MTAEILRQPAPSDLLPGAEPWSYEGGRAGVLCLHGFTGHPGSMRRLAEAFAAADFSVELPRLPGHGTTIEDMVVTGWVDWSAAAEAGLARLARRCDVVVVVGQSMGGALAAWLGTRHDGLAGIVCINALVLPMPDEAVEMVRAMVDDGDVVVPGSGADIADPDVVETAYDATPLVPLLSLMEGLGALRGDLVRITSPLLVITSRQDHVVDPENSDVLAAAASGPVERLYLDRSYHVATLDYDAELVRERSIAFVRRVAGQGPTSAR